MKDSQLRMSRPDHKLYDRTKDEITIGESSGFNFSFELLRINVFQYLHNSDFHYIVK